MATLENHHAELRQALTETGKRQVLDRMKQQGVRVDASVIPTLGTKVAIPRLSSKRLTYARSDLSPRIMGVIDGYSMEGGHYRVPCTARP